MRLPELTSRLLKMRLRGVARRARPACSTGYLHTTSCRKPHDWSQSTVCGPRAPLVARGSLGPHAMASSFRIRTRLKTAMHMVKSQSTFATPLIFDFVIKPTVFAQPNISSTRFRFRWLIA